MYMWIAWTELFAFVFFLFCFFDKVQELEQEKISLEGAMQELGQVSCFLLFVWATYAQVCSP